MMDLSLSNMSTNICWSQPCGDNRGGDVMSELQHALWTWLGIKTAPWTDRSSERLQGWCRQRWQSSSREASCPVTLTHLRGTGHLKNTFKISPCKNNVTMTTLTKHSLRVPGVGVPGADSVLHHRRDTVGNHVVDGVVHGGAEVSLSCGGCTNDVPHLRRALSKCTICTKTLISHPIVMWG